MDLEWIIMYDGYCNLCSGIIQWIVRNDRRGRFSFKPLQGPPSSGNTVTLIEQGRTYNRSTAVLRIACRLRFPWPLLSIFLLVPRLFRDPLYNMVARNRKRWFGERNTCYLPNV